MASKKLTNNKTQPRKVSAVQYIAQLEHVGRREDATILLNMMEAITGEKATMWGSSIVGFGRYHYVYESGREGDAFLTGFAPRQANMVVYVMPGFSEFADLLESLGKHKTGASCLYLGRLTNIDEKVLHKIISASVKHMRKKYNV